MSGALEAFAKRTDLQKFAPNALAIFALQLRFGIDDPEELADAITDGDGDKKVDVFYIDDEFGAAVIVQAYESDDPEKVNPPLNKVTDLNTAVSWLIKPSTIEGLRPEIESAAAQLEAALEDGLINTIEIWFAHNCPDNADVDKELEQVAITAKALLDQVQGERGSGVDVRGVQVGRDRLETFYAHRTQQVLIEDTLKVPSDAWLEQRGDVWSAVCTSVPGSWLRELYTQYGPDQLFAGNVRDFLGIRRSKANINHNIATTVRDRPTDFWAFNNGVTALVSDFVADAEKHALAIRGITIVNGAQTTGAINAGNASDEVKVLMRFVKCADRSVVRDLIRANNTQNAIVSSDFRSNDRHQARLREEFKNIPLAHYTGARRGEVAEAAGDDDVHISADVAAQALAALHGEPQRAYHGKSRIWEDEHLYERFFAPASGSHIVYAASLIRAINDEKRRLREKTERGQVEQRVLDFLSQRGAPFLLAAAIGRCQEMILDAAVPDLFRLSFGDQVGPAVAEEHWTPVVRSLAAFHSKLAAAAESGKIRSADLRERALGDFVDAVYANLEALKGTVFADFRPHVIVTQTPQGAETA